MELTEEEPLREVQRTLLGPGKDNPLNSIPPGNKVRMGKKEGKQGGGRAGTAAD